MLRFFDTYFQTFTIHNYSDTDRGSRVAVGDTWNIMVSLGKQRQIWVTEFNFRHGTCPPLSEQNIVDYTRSLYNLMYNERAFYFSIDDGFTGACGLGLLLSGSYNYAEKPILYPGFKSIVSGH
jgi:hypothetical protein